MSHKDVIINSLKLILLAPPLSKSTILIQLLNIHTYPVKLIMQQIDEF